MAKKFKVPLGLAVLEANPASATTGDVYYNTDMGPMVYTGTDWVPLYSSTMIDGGSYESLAGYQGGEPSDISTQTFDGGNP